MAIPDSGAICAQDAGLGKGIWAYVYPLLKVGLLRDAAGVPVKPVCPREPVLLVASGDLHTQILEEGRDKFKVRPTLLDSQQTFLRLSSLDPRTGRRTLPPGYYLTTYTELTRNGVIPFPKFNHADPSAACAALNVTEREIEDYFTSRVTRLAKCYELLEIRPNTPDETAAHLHAQWLTLRKEYIRNEQRCKDLDDAYYDLKNFIAARPAREFNDLDPAQQRFLKARLARDAHEAASQNVDRFRDDETTGRTVKCVYSPSLADLCCDTFAVLVGDEAVKIKSATSHIGIGFRQINARHRMIMTATPIKNRLPDIFFLAHTAAGGHYAAHPRFPFGRDGQEDFAGEFSITERNLSREQEKGGRFVRRTPQVCNIHRLWKLLAPLICRRRFEDCGEDVVKQVRHVIRVPMGLHQAAAYKFHIDAKYLDINGREAIGARLQALRICAANPASALLKRPESDKDRTPGQPASPHAYIPKVAATLTLIAQILERGEQVVIFSAFHDSLDCLSARLHEAGIRHVVLDSRVSPAKRGVAAAQFKRGPAGAIPVMLAGVESMSEGHSFNLCNNAILLAYSWAWDKFLQAIKRILRLTSTKDVNVYSLLCDGTIDRRLEGNIMEKQDATELVLDGHLLGEDPHEVNLAELLQSARADFAHMQSSLIDERDLVKEWPTLRTRLAAAMRAWNNEPAAETIIPLECPSTPMLLTNGSADLPIVLPDHRSSAPADFDDLPLWQQAA
ncbi:MAG TPA: DEAD/DEAH box helicase [Verrucomicrobiae bacterium]|nr:DEAD/DEAH box helicase [Verrucomicrobiae bacterium]